MPYGRAAGATSRPSCTRRTRRGISRTSSSAVASRPRWRGVVSASRSPRSSSRWASGRMRSTSSLPGRWRRGYRRGCSSTLAVVSVAGACAIGIAVAVTFSLWILPLVAAGAFLVPAYNLELLGGRFHSDTWFALSWGAFPVVTGYVACAGSVRIETVLAAAWAALLVARATATVDPGTACQASGDVGHRRARARRWGQRARHAGAPGRRPGSGAAVC